MHSLRHQFESFNSEASVSSISSIESLLDSRRDNLEDILFSLGFGVGDDENPINKIPKRFLESPSVAKGINLEEFIKANTSLNKLVDQQSSAVRQRSYSYTKVQKKFGRKDEVKNFVDKSMSNDNLPEIITPTSAGLSFSESILNAENREFLEKQGKTDSRSGFKKLVIGEKSYHFANDGDPLAFPKTPSPKAITPISNETEERMNNDEMIVINKLPSALSPKENCDRNISKRGLLKRQSRVSECHTSECHTSEGHTSDNFVNSDLFLKPELSIHDNSEFVMNNVDCNANPSKFCDAECQTENCQIEHETIKVAEAAFTVAVQSLKLSLEFYRIQSMKFAKFLENNNQSVMFNNEEFLEKIEKISKFGDKMYKEIMKMDELLSFHLAMVKSSKEIDFNILNEAKIFIETLENSIKLLQEGNFF